MGRPLLSMIWCLSKKNSCVTRYTDLNKQPVESIGGLFCFPLWNSIPIHMYEPSIQGEAIEMMT